MIPLTELKAQLTTVNAAIEKLISGDKLSLLRVGSGTFQRTYQWQEITLESLTSLRNSLLQQIAAQEQPILSLDSFGRSMTIPLLVSKDIF